MDETNLSRLLQDCIDHYHDVSDLPVVKDACGPERQLIPIPYFGDIEAFHGSESRIVTAGLNPSLYEFNVSPREIKKTRFDIQRGLESPAALRKTLGKYYEWNPYPWFKNFEKVLNGCGASYYAATQAAGLVTNRALHIDICSPIATNPTWSKLCRNGKHNVARQKLTDTGNTFFLRLLSILQPDIVIASVGWRHLKKVHGCFADGAAWPVIYQKPFDRNGNVPKVPQVVRARYVSIDGSKHIWFANGTAADVPFGRFLDDQKAEAGREIYARSELRDRAKNT